MKTPIIFIDPPSGWMYGFPKPAPENLRELSIERLNTWLVENGYPREEIDRWNKGMPIRFFEMEVDYYD